MSGKPIDISGKRFGRLKAVFIDYYDKHRNAVWLCECDCGNLVAVMGSLLRNGTTQSCGCLQRERTSKANRKHGGSETRLYRIYHHIKERCHSPSCKQYPLYGGRGIRMCEPWRADFEAFSQWAYENGYSETAYAWDCTIDRIDPNGDYSPQNCRWANMTQQANNKRTNVLVTVNGITKTIAEWGRETGQPSSRLYARKARGWGDEEIVYGKRL